MVYYWISADLGPCFGVSISTLNKYSLIYQVKWAGLLSTEKCLLPESRLFKNLKKRFSS